MMLSNWGTMTRAGWGVVVSVVLPQNALRSCKHAQAASSAKRAGVLFSPLRPPVAQEPASSRPASQLRRTRRTARQLPPNLSTSR